VVELNVLVT